MNPEAMSKAHQKIHRDGPVRGRYVIEVEVLETEHGTIAEVEVRAHTWTEGVIHLAGKTRARALRDVGRVIERTIAAHEGSD